MFIAKLNWAYIFWLPSRHTHLNVLNLSTHNIKLWLCWLEGTSLSGRLGKIVSRDGLRG